MGNLTPNQQQLINYLLTIFSASGPIVALLLVKQGVDQTTINILMTWLTAVGPAILQLIVVGITHTHAAQVLTAENIPGVQTTVDPATAPKAVVALANDNTNAVKIAA